MLFGFSRPQNVTWSLDPAVTGSAFLTSVRLDNGQPAEITRINWLSGAVIGLLQNIGLRADWPVPKVIRVVCIVGLSCPAGVLVEAYGKRSGDAGYAYSLGAAADSRTFELPDGRVAIWLVLADGLTALVGLDLRIYNDADSANWATEDTDLDVGEVGIFAARDLPVSPGWTRGFSDPSINANDLAGGLRTAAFRGWRELGFTLQVASVADTRGEGISGEDWETLEASTVGDSRCCAIVDYSTEALTNRTAVFGRATFGSIDNRSANYSGTTCKVREVPAL